MSRERPSDGLRDEPGPWPVLDTHDIHRDSWVLALRADQVTTPGGGEPFRRFVVELPGAAMILAVDDQERAVVLRQYRHPVGSRLVEIPAGLLDVPGEDPLLAAQRELREEAGLQAAHWQHLVSVHPSPGISTESHAIFLATGLAEADRGDFELRHEEAEMSLDMVPVDELIDAVFDGRVHDAPLVTSVLAYDALRRRGRLPGRDGLTE